jgi:cobalt-zinc-cadmium efflux system protein
VCALASSDHRRVSRNARLWLVLAANLVLIGVLAAVGASAHSLAVFAEGADYLADAAAIGVSLLAIYLVSRHPTRHHPGGYPKATRYAALVSAGWLLVLSLVVDATAAYRLVARTPVVHGLPVLVVSAIAAAVMLGAAVLLRGDPGDGSDEGEELHVRAVLLETAGAAAAAAGVAVTGAVIYATHDHYWLDPAVALAIAGVVGYHAGGLVFRVRHALAE